MSTVPVLCREVMGNRGERGRAVAGGRPARADAWRRARRWVLVAAGVAAAAALLLFFSLRLSGSPSSTYPPAGRDAVVAPELTLAAADREIPLSALRGELVLLYFTFPG